METQYSRTELIFGSKALEKLWNCKVAVFGLGGVGGYAAEALARSGIGTLDLIDNDVICLSNLNRQIYATHSTIGMDKVQAAAQRIADINPQIRVNAHKVFYLPETAALFDFAQYDYIIDAIDTVTAKIALVQNALAAGTPIISSMGTGNKTDPSALTVADISKTSVCPLARVMRRELRKRGIEHLKVVYSKEPPRRAAQEQLLSNSEQISPENTAETAAAPGAEHKKPGPRIRQVPGSTAFVPPAAGLMIAGEVIRDLLSAHS